MKGIILAGGSGTRLRPTTSIISKQLLPLYDKPMIYYSLATLMQINIRDILIISTPNDLHLYEKLLGSGNQWGIELSYKIQPHPGGIPQAFLIGEKFINYDSICLMLGDNFLYGDSIIKSFNNSIMINDSATIFSYRSENPKSFGVIEFNEDNSVKNILEKPDNPPSNWIVTGLYRYDNNVIDIAKEIKPSMRGELEITDINKIYLENNKLFVEKLNSGVAWFDTGTFDDMLKASNFIHTIENIQGVRIGCLEEIAYRNGYINKDKLMERYYPLRNTGYGKHIYNNLINPNLSYLNHQNLTDDFFHESLMPSQN